MNKKGFTIVELLVVVAIIGILTAMATMSYQSVHERSRDSQRMNDLNQVKVALSSYYAAQAIPLYVIATSKTTINGSTDTLSAALEPNYIREMPVDPVNTGNYVYKYQSSNSNKDFTLFGTLENTANKKGWGGGTQWVADGYQLKSE